MRVQRKYLQLACLNLFLVMSVILCPHQTYAKGKKFKIYFTNAEKSIKLPLKSSQTLSVRYSKKKKASYKIKWESSNPRVVKVSKKGILTPKKTGKSVIRHVVRTKSGKVIAKKSIKVKVTPEIAIKAISCEEDAASETLIKYPTNIVGMFLSSLRMHLLLPLLFEAAINPLPRSVNLVLSHL